MNLKWCAFTGALMLVFVAATFYHKEVTQDPPGVSTRWWDGSLQSVEHKYANGKLEQRTTYGDDGKTVLTYETWDSKGKLMHSKIRRKDGRVEEKLFREDSESLASFKLWNGDELTFVVEQKFGRNGKLLSEVIMTEDGLVAAEQRQFDDKGNLQIETRVLDNADQETSMFSGGVRTARNVFKANGDSWSESFDEKGRLTSRDVRVRLDNSSVRETFAPDGKVTARSEHDGKPASLTHITVFEGDKVKLRQTVKNWSMVKVEEVSVQTGLATRVLQFDQKTSTVNRVEIIRKDGTLERVKLLDIEGKVTKTIEYDATGKTVASEKEGGDPEAIDPKLLNDATGGF
ncbi:MAG: hypothetical protein SGJ27_31405 [Candidatus Melainabacteria bacterium]|nr:hypothetical protein [Candidatus Melainabacteria bacterium]